MTAVEWTALAVSLLGLAILFLWTTLVANAWEERRREREARRRYMAARRHPSGRAR